MVDQIILVNTPPMRLLITALPIGFIAIAIAAYFHYQGTLFYYGMQSALFVIGRFDHHFGDHNLTHLSPEAKALNIIFRLFPLRPRNVYELRQQMAFNLHPPLGSSYRQTVIKELRDSILVEHNDAPLDIVNRTAILYAHGGGLVGGLPEQGFPWIQEFPPGVDMLAVRYALAPEHIIYEAIDDVFKSYKYLEAKGYSKIVMLGDSAGGLLTTLAIANHMQSDSYFNENSKLDALVLFSPWLDPTTSTRSFLENAEHDLVLTESVKTIINDVLTNLLLKNVQDTSQQLSVMQTFSIYYRMVVEHEPIRFPRLFLVYSSTERLADENSEFFEEIQRRSSSDQRVRNRKRTVAHLQHVYPMFCHYIPEAKEALQETVAFVLEK
jgi:acetyl esterase/lipase